jgi:hypothetical protein
MTYLTSCRLNTPAGALIWQTPPRERHTPVGISGDDVGSSLLGKEVRLTGNRLLMANLDV